jgi:hypothetical protein
MKKLYFSISIYKWYEIILPFFCPMKNNKEIKNIKISPSSHELLKKYCDRKGLKIYKFLENLIEETCKDKKDIYGED